jgi:protein gp37
MVRSQALVLYGVFSTTNAVSRSDSRAAAMGDTTEISWTDSTFNPWIGCQHVSPGCDHCYAEAQNAFRRWTDGGRWGPHAPRTRTSTTTWHKPRLWNHGALAFADAHGGRRRRVFCASLADVFDNKVPKTWRADLFRLIWDTPDLDWQLLTKRPQNIARMLPADWGDGYANVWLGATMEDAERFCLRWPILSRIPAACRFVSYEPAIASLGPLDIVEADCLPDWVICGGESGARARIMHPTWARDVRDQCCALGIAFLHKQWGTYRSNPLVQERRLSPAEAEQRDPATNGKGGALLDGRLYRQFPGKRSSRSGRGNIAIGGQARIFEPNQKGVGA